MNVQVGTSKRGRLTLIYQGYENVKKQEKNTTTHWIRRHYRQTKCSSSVIPSRSKIINTPKDHICNLKPGATEARQAKNKTKEKSLTTTNYVAIASTLQEIQNDVATQLNLPLQETIVKSLNRYTRKLANVRTCFSNCTQFMLKLVFTTHPVYTLSYQTKVRKRSMILPKPYYS